MKRTRLIANLGDAHPLESGGLFVFQGPHGPYMERCEPLSEREGAPLEVHTVMLDRCTFTDGVLSDIPGLPGHAVWFTATLAGICATMDYPRDEFIADITSADPVRLAHAWRAVLDYHGWANGDGYPARLTVSEARKRLRAVFRKSRARTTA